jgi:hypothetical protein
MYTFRICATCALPLHVYLRYMYSSIHLCHCYYLIMLISIDAETFWKPPRASGAYLPRTVCD